jgi:excisionase family DNA binding protein
MVNHNENKNPDISLLFQKYPDIMNARQLQQALGIGRIGAYKLLASGKIYSFKVGNAYKIPRTSLIEYVSGGRVEYQNEK